MKGFHDRWYIFFGLATHFVLAQSTFDGAKLPDSHYLAFVIPFKYYDKFVDLRGGDMAHA